MVDSSAVASNVDAGGGCSSAAGGGGAGVVGDASSVCNIAFCSCQSGCVVVRASTAFTVCLLHLHSMKLSGEKRLLLLSIAVTDHQSATKANHHYHYQHHHLPTVSDGGGNDDHRPQTPAHSSSIIQPYGHHQLHLAGLLALVGRPFIPSLCAQYQLVHGSGSALTAVSHQQQCQWWRGSGSTHTGVGGSRASLPVCL